MTSSTAGEASETTVPHHIAIVMDGNGRWAEQRGQQRHSGHRAGVASVRSTIEESIRQGVGALTLFAFSSENWRRPQAEVGLLMELFLQLLQREVKRLHVNGIRLRVVGDTSAFDDKIRERIAAAEELTRGNDRLLLQIAANYGGRWDIIQAARQLAEAARAGVLEPDAIDESKFAGVTALGDVPDPDLFIRTGGEVRISNFLLWHSAYTEFYFTDVLWPDFDASALRDAIAEFARRQRRFGKTGSQLEATR